jgi:hypothetical protein
MNFLCYLNPHSIPFTSLHSPELVRNERIIYPLDDKLIRELPDLHEIDVQPVWLSLNNRNLYLIMLLFQMSTFPI